MSVLGVANFSKKGWVRLPYRFSDSSLTALSQLDCHRGRGQRLTDMVQLSGLIPPACKYYLIKFGVRPTPLRAVGFNKTPDENWSLPWHQDRVIAMTKRVEDPQYRNWTRKSGVWHCEPPTDHLRKMAFVYIAFDDMDRRSGGLELASGSHHLGVLQGPEIDRTVKGLEVVCPNLNRGEVLLVSALTLHRSAISTQKSNRRSLRIDFATTEFNTQVADGSVV